MAGALGLNSHSPSHPDGGEARGLAAAFLIALALHAGALGLVAAWRSAVVVAPPGEQEITIDLAPDMVEAPSVAPAEASQLAGAPAEAEAVQPPAESVTAQPAEQAVVPPPVEAVIPPPETAARVEPAPSVEAPPFETARTVAAPAPVQTPAPPIVTEAVLPPEQRPIESNAVEALVLLPAAVPLPDPAAIVAALPPPETVTARPLPEPRPAPRPVARRPAPQSAPVPRPTEQAAPPGAAGPSISEASRPAETRENTSGAAAAADPDAMRRYAAQLAAALKRRLRYPEAARAAGETGSATMRFTLHRSGRVLSASIVRSAGHPALDQAALETVSADAALPPAPAGVPQEQITFSVPLRFDMR